jgi:hypothetical protein
MRRVSIAVVVWALSLCLALFPSPGQANLSIRPKPPWPVLNRAHPLAQGLMSCLPLAEGNGYSTTLCLHDVCDPNAFVTMGSSTAAWKGALYGTGLYFNLTSVSTATNTDTVAVGPLSAFTFCGILTFPSESNETFVELDSTSLELVWQGNGTNHLSYVYPGQSSVTVTPGVNETQQVVILTGNSSAGALYINGSLASTGAGFTGVAASSLKLVNECLSTSTTNTTQVWGGFWAYNRAFSASDAAQFSQDPFAMLRPKRFPAFSLIDWLQAN